jgi:hypothetical protein
MRRVGARAVYCVLLRLHPRGFADDFGGEMLRVFDDAAETYGTSWLLGDAVVSLGRQRLVRSQAEQSVVASPFCLLAGNYPDVKPPHLTAGKLSLALVLTLLSSFIFPQRIPIRIHRDGGLSIRLEVGNGSRAGR